MNKSKIFRTAHQTAKATRNNFATYKEALSAALTKAWAESKKPALPLFAKYGLTAKVERALEAIKNGSKFNGTVYGKNARRSRPQQILSIYVDGKEYFLGAIYTEDVQQAKKEFLAAVHNTKSTTPNTRQNNCSIFGASSEGENENYRLSKTDHLEFAI